MSQTSKKANVYFKDGMVVSLKASGESSYTDVGAIEGDTVCTMNWDEEKVESGNAGILAVRIKNMTMAGTLTLQNLEPASIARFSGGMITEVTTAGSAVSTIPNQVIAANWDDNRRYELVLYTSSSDSTKLRTTAKPTLTSVTLDAAGTPEVLTENNDYVIVADANTYSGWAIQFISANMTTGTPKTKAITIDYGTNTPVASSTLYAGSSTFTFSAYAMQVTHTDETTGLKRYLDLPSVNPNSGGFVFSFGGATSGGVETMPLAFTANLDSTKVTGRQLMGWTVENGAS